MPNASWAQGRVYISAPVSLRRSRRLRERGTKIDHYRVPGCRRIIHVNLLSTGRSAPFIARVSVTVSHLLHHPQIAPGAVHDRLIACKQGARLIAQRIPSWIDPSIRDRNDVTTSITHRQICEKRRPDPPSKLGLSMPSLSLLKSSYQSSRSASVCLLCNRKPIPQPVRAHQLQP